MNPLRPKPVVFKRSALALALLLGLAGSAAAAPGDISTVAGTGVGGFDGDGSPALEAEFRLVNGLAIDAGGTVYLADLFNNRVRRIDSATGIVTTIAGTGALGSSGDGGPAIEARLSGPRAVALDREGQLYIVDQGNNRIRRMDSATGVLTTVAGTGLPGFRGDGGPATEARLFLPSGIAFDSENHLYIADQSNHRIRKVDAHTGVITTIAGTFLPGYRGDGGDALGARLLLPTSLAVDADGNVYIVDQGNLRVRRIDAATNVITTVAGSGVPGFLGDGDPAVSARLLAPTGIALDAAGNLFIADQGNLRIRRVDAATGEISTVAGNGLLDGEGDGGAATEASLVAPRNLAFDSMGNLFVADQGTHRIRRIEAAGEPVRFQADNSIGVAATSMRGTGVHNLTGLGQSVALRSRQNRRATFHFAVANEAVPGHLYFFGKDSLAVHATRGNRNLPVSYRDVRGAQVTAAITTGRLTLGDFAPGDAARFTAVVSPRLKSGSRRRAYSVTSRSQTAAHGADRIDARVQATFKKRRGSAAPGNQSPPPRVPLSGTVPAR